MPRLTIGMACFEDFDGPYFTIQALRMYFAQHMADVELVVVNNGPSKSPISSMLQQLVREKIPRGLAQVKYVEMPAPVGTSAPRDRIVQEASAEYVMVLDSHVMLIPGALDSLFSYLDAHQNCDDILSGPIVWDHLGGFATHYDDVWRREMYGVWAAAWQCRCGHDGVRFSMQPSAVDAEGNAQSGAQAVCRLLTPGEELGKVVPITSCFNCGTPFPIANYAGHERVFHEHGYTALGSGPNDPAFEIPGMGLGLFVVRKATWPGFNPHARGFGGEEMYIHQKYRNRGNRALCLPGLKWVHRFGRASVPYPLTLWNKVRNYVLEFNELGLSLDPVREHFVGQRFTAEMWDKLVSDPIGMLAPPTVVQQTGSGTVTMQPADLDTIYKHTANAPSDINEHIPTLKEFAAKAAGVVVEVVPRVGNSTVGLLAGQPKSLFSYGPRANTPLFERLVPVRGSTDMSAIIEDSLASDIPYCDLLFIDTQHTEKRLAAELSRHTPRCRRFIAIHDTEIYGQNGEDGGPGLLSAIAQFLIAYPDWFVCYHAKNNHGFTVLSKNPEDRPAEPIMLIPPGAGPGTELKRLLATLGIAPGPNCQCNKRAREMDAWGVAGCRENKNTIVQWMREGQATWGWMDRITAAARAVHTGLALRISWVDPWPDIIDLCIEQAEQKEQANADAA